MLPDTLSPERSVAFYHGLNTWESGGGAPPPRGTTGLYHFAILYPTRAALADGKLSMVTLPLDLESLLAE